MSNSDQFAIYWNVLLKAKAYIGCADLTINADKEKDLIAQFKVTDKNTIDFDRFYELIQFIIKEAESKIQDLEDLDYGTLIDGLITLISWCLCSTWRESQ